MRSRRSSRSASRDGDRVVLVVHGKGNHSPRGQAVLRGEIAAWLSQGRSARHVAAFATAPDDARRHWRACSCSWRADRDAVSQPLARAPDAPPATTKEPADGRQGEEYLDGGRAHRLGRRQAPPPHAHDALRARRLRGDPRLPPRRRVDRDLPPPRAPHPPLRLVQADDDRAALHPRAGHRGVRRRSSATTRMDEAYLRPIVWVGDGAMGVYAPDNPIRTAVVAWRWGAYLGKTALEQGIRVKVSSWARHHIHVSLAKGKIMGQYTNSMHGQARGQDGRLRRGRAHGRAGLRQRGLRREPLHRQEGQAHHAAALGVDPGGHHPRHHPHARPRGGHPRRRGDDHPRPALPRRRGLLHRHRRRGHPHPRGRQPQDRRGRSAPSPSGSRRATSTS